MGGQLPALLPGYRVRILDGNHLAATERRLHVLLQSKAGPLPGHSLVVLDPALMLATNMIPCEDGHAQERSLSPEILALVAAKDVWIADRNFCTFKLLWGMVERLAFFCIRQHANMTVLPKSDADAVAVAKSYRNRWTLETMFQSLTTMFQGERRAYLRMVESRTAFE